MIEEEYEEQRDDSQREITVLRNAVLALPGHKVYFDPGHVRVSTEWANLLILRGDAAPGFVEYGQVEEDLVSARVSQRREQLEERQRKIQERQEAMRRERERRMEERRSFRERIVEK